MIDQLESKHNYISTYATVWTIIYGLIGPAFDTTVW